MKETQVKKETSTERQATVEIATYSRSQIKLFM
jgi:hypothetical protein